MDKETLSNYGWIVICILVLSVMIALATPFGRYIATAVENTTQGLFDVQQKAMGVAGLVVDDQNFEGSSSESGGTATEDPLNPNDGTGVYDGMIYTSGNYEYRYNQFYNNISSWETNTTQNGWGVRCISNMADPGPILESINGESVTNMFNTFKGCTALTTAPEIPSSVTNMANTFNGCTSLQTYAGSTNPDGDFSGYIIPNSVTIMNYTFCDCTSLTLAPAIPNSVTGMSNTFYNCTSLTTAPTIPSRVTNMYSTFYGCTSLTGIIRINATNLTSYSSCFYDVDMDYITLTGSASTDVLNRIGATGNNWTQID